MRTNKSTVQGFKRNFTTICVVTSHNFSLLDRTGDLEIKNKTFYYKIIFLNRSIIEIFNFPASLLCYFIPCVCKNWVNWIKAKTAGYKKRQNNYLPRELYIIFGLTSSEVIVALHSTFVPYHFSYSEKWYRTMSMQHINTVITISHLMNKSLMVMRPWWL